MSPFESDPTEDSTFERDTAWCAASELDEQEDLDAAVSELESARSLLGSGSLTRAQDSRGLVAALYPDLRRVARAHLRRLAPGHTLSPTALTHEAWIRLDAQRKSEWHNRDHFIAMASLMMRRILVNHEVARRADKRHVERVPLTLSHAESIAAPADPDIVALHEALLAFEQLDPRAAKGVELRYFAGLENEEIAEVLGISVATVKRDWTVARAWLHRELTPPASSPP